MHFSPCLKILEIKKMLQPRNLLTIIINEHVNLYSVTEEPLLFTKIRLVNVIGLRVLISCL